MVATQEARASAVGINILRKGGNAIDAAVAVGFALAVTLPRAGNLGGGGFMMIHHAAQAKTVAIDYRESAPAGATRDMFLDAKGGVDKKRARFSHLSVGVPGTPAGLLLALERFGSLPRDVVMAPAIRMAREGIEITPSLAAALRYGTKRLKRWPASRAIFLTDEGKAPAVGATLVQADLARTLERIAQHGSAGFYAGETARLLAAQMRSNGGLIDEADLAAYRPKVRAPVWGTYRGYEIYSMPPPSSGGVHLVQILNLLEGFPIRQWGANSADTIHAMAESMKLAYADRSEYLGDPDYWKVPVKGLTSKHYADALRAGINMSRARPAKSIKPGNPLDFESEETTHFSIIDKAGNAVANTYTLNFSFGTGIVAAGTGVLLNNEMDDFSAKPGVPNAYGLIGGEANAIEKGKRPLSSMTPTLVMKDGKAFLATGSPGGSRIITTTLQVLVNVIDHEMNIAAATLSPRVHHQWQPDYLRIEAGISRDTVELLNTRGHEVKVKRAMGSVQSVMRVEGGLFGASDTRRAGALTLGY
ncbi:MAG: gamma-glutamyltransferase [Gammaproteobacteria bacterium]|nr:gamma-glutamyltransferase [Gammaproteobacteria bacterium]